MYSGDNANIVLDDGPKTVVESTRKDKKSSEVDEVVSWILMICQNKYLLFNGIYALVDTHLSS